MCNADEELEEIYAPNKVPEGALWNWCEKSTVAQQVYVKHLGSPEILREVRGAAAPQPGGSGGREPPRERKTV